MDVFLATMNSEKSFILTVGSAPAILLQQRMVLSGFCQEGILQKSHCYTQASQNMRDFAILTHAGMSGP